MRIARFLVDDEPTYGVVDHHDGRDVIVQMTGDPLFGQMKATGRVVPLGEARLLAPVIPRSKVIGIGRNFAAHATELGNPTPAEPVVFIKPNTAVIGPDDPVVMPAFSQDVHFEGELAVVISRLCKDVPVARAKEVIGGYTIANDVTARDVQASDVTWARAKGFDTSCPLGPYLVTDFDPTEWTLTTTVAGAERQRGTAQELIFDVPTLVSYVSSIFSLLPGDVILTGTPAGVGPVNSGESVEVSITGLGTLRNPFLRRDADDQ